MPPDPGDLPQHLGGDQLVLVGRDQVELVNRQNGERDLLLPGEILQVDPYGQADDQRDDDGYAGADLVHVAAILHALGDDDGARYPAEPRCGRARAPETGPVRARPAREAGMAPVAGARRWCAVRARGRLPALCAEDRPVILKGGRWRAESAALRR